ncbi:MAG: hypothetical protein P8I44_07140, partial [Phycisphaerales bacterium]|nr:hypothetical protein [Phycisphaerales bacterium]
MNSLSLVLALEPQDFIGFGIAAVAGAILAWLLITATTGKSIGTAKAEAATIVEAARSDAQAAARTIEAEVEAKATERR